MEKSLGIVIITWNSEKVIQKCLESIDRLNYNNFKVIIIDNGSTDQTIAIIENFQRHCNISLEIIKLQKNYGTTKSRNIGIKKLLEYQYIAILDSDTIVNQVAFDTMISVLEEDKFNGIVGPKMKSLDGKVQNSGRKIPTIKVKLYKVLPLDTLHKKAEQLEFYNDINRDKNTAVGYLMSACWIMKREVVDRIGYLDEKIFYAPEDIEYCIRAWLNGYRVVYCNDAEIIHEWQRLSRKKIISKHNWEHIKGLFYMYNKYKFWFNAEKIQDKVK